MKTDVIYYDASYYKLLEDIPHDVFDKLIYKYKQGNIVTEVNEICNLLYGNIVVTHELTNKVLLVDDITISLVRCNYPYNDEIYLSFNLTNDKIKNLVISYYWGRYTEKNPTNKYLYESDYSLDGNEFNNINDFVNYIKNIE